MKKIFALAIMVVSVFVFSGCSTKRTVALDMKPEKTEALRNVCFQISKRHKDACLEDKMTLTMITTKSNLPTYGFRYKITNNGNAAFIQAAAQTAEKKGKRFFAIVKPDYLSNTNGSLLNTPEEFFKECDVNVATFFSSGNKCGIAKNDGVVAFFDERPNDFMVWSTEDVITHLKTLERYDNEVEILSFSLDRLSQKQFDYLKFKFK